jgi:protein tyrosine/serine phosphatase
MFQRIKKGTILATLLFCATLYLACSDPNPPFSVEGIASHVTAENDSIIRTSILGNDQGRQTSSDIYLDFPADSFLTKFKIGDIVTVAIVNYDTLEIPVVESSYDVPIAGFSLLARTGSEHLILSIHYGELADILGLTNEKTPIDVTITLKDKGGYEFGLDIMQNAQYLSTYKESYPNLSIEEFANFREVRTTGMGQHKLYRSSSPIDLSLGRNLYADSLAKEAGVATFINLADAKDNAKTFEDFEGSYYSTQNTIFLGLPVEFFSTSFEKGLVTGFRYMIEHEGPYLVHCTYGMDRTGFTIAVLEALMGATVEDIQADYAKTFSNYYNIVNSKQISLNEQQVEFFKNVVIRNLRAVFHAEGIDVPETANADWASATEQYLQKLGMTAEEISALKEKLK